jgi:hypothetical protein
MTEFFENLQNLIQEDYFFWFCALAGTGMFLVQFALNFVGAGDHDSDVETDTIKVRWLSKQAAAGFLMMFGWSALTCLHQFGLQRLVASVIGVGAGGVAVMVNGFIFKMAKKLRSSGSVFKIDDAVGKEAVVYQRIPKEGVGKISVSLHDMTHEIDAVACGEEIPSFTPVQIVSKKNDHTLVVIPKR